MIYTDAHIHFANLLTHDVSFIADYKTANFRACAVSHSPAEYEQTEKLIVAGLQCIQSFGLHPQAAVWDHADFLCELLTQKKINIIGEAGFDFFADTPLRVRTPENETMQKAIFEFQLELANKYATPIVIHCRKASDLLFAYSARLKKLPAVIFHSYSGTTREAGDLLKRGINAYFSFGTSILNNHKEALRACVTLPLQNILAETDAPWQPPRGEKFCAHHHIITVTEKIALLRGLEKNTLCATLHDNFCRAYLLDSKR